MKRRIPAPTRAGVSHLNGAPIVRFSSSFLSLSSQVEFVEELFPDEVPVVSFFPSDIGESLFISVRYFVPYMGVPTLPRNRIVPLYRSYPPPAYLPVILNVDHYYSPFRPETPHTLYPPRTHDCISPLPFVS